MYSLNYKVTTSTCDSDGKLKLYSALQMMQDCSEMWIDSEQSVKDYFEKENMAQLLASRQVEVIRRPSFKEELAVTTSVYGMKSMFGCRNTFIYDAEGLPCYRTWLPKEGGTVLAPVAVQRADIDYNKHVNNANYIRMAMELLPDGFEVKGLRVEYRVPAKLNDQLVPTVYQQDELFIVALNIGNDVSTIIEFI